MRSCMLCLLVATLLPANAAGQASRKALTHDEFSDWRAYTQAGWLGVKRNDLKYAEAMFKRAIDLGRIEADTDPRLMARSYGDLAWVLHVQGRDAEAEPLAKWALSVREKAFGADTISLGQTAYTLAVIEIDLGQLDEAEALLTRWLAACEKNLGPTHVSTADALDDLAAVLVRRRKYDRARPLYDRALTILRPHSARSNPLVGLATIEIEQGKLTEAEAHLDQALQALERDPTADPSFHAGVLSQKADVLRKTGRPAEADSAEAQSKAVAARSRPAQSESRDVPRPGWIVPARGATQRVVRP
jgi:tetratricopeptide (TPR) repeat protein